MQQLAACPKHTLQGVMGAELLGNSALADCCHQGSGLCCVLVKTRLRACCRSETDKKALVAALTQPTGQQRRVGPATAQKLFTILTSTDPDAVVEA